MVVSQIRMCAVGRGLNCPSVTSAHITIIQAIEKELG